LADRLGPRLFMGGGPLIAGAGLALMLRLEPDADYVSQLLPALVVFGLGLSMTVAPLTATVLAAVEERHSGVASGVNNAIARIAGLLAIAVLGAVVSTRFEAVVDERLADRPLGATAQSAVADAKERSMGPGSAARIEAPAERREVTTVLEDASTSAFHLGLGLGAALVVAGGLVSLAGIRNPRREVPCVDCPGGSLVGASEELGRVPEIELAGRAPVAGAAGA
ncbi:MAG TPA: hypothetical protein VF606_11930, partial [Geminicoccaceae bacterium]